MNFLLRLVLDRPTRREHDERALAKRRLENLLRQHDVSRSKAREICWHFFNDEGKSS